MAMRKKSTEPLPYNIFVGERPWTDFSEAEKEEYGRKVVSRLGEFYNDYFGSHPEAYKEQIS